MPSALAKRHEPCSPRSSPSRHSRSIEYHKNAIHELDLKVCEKAKQLNLLRYERLQKMQRISDMDASMAQEKSALKKHGKLAKYDQQTIRMIENNLDKAKIKHDMAMKIQRNYIEILQCLEEERLTLPKKLRCLERTLEEQRKELDELKDINKDAHVKKDLAKSELTQLEQKMIEAKRSRDRTLTRMKKQAERQKEMAEKIERRARATLQTDDATQDTKRQSQMDEDNWVKVTTYEEAFQRIKDATGVSDINEIEARFLSQNSTFEHLEQQKQSGEKQRKWLEEQNRQLLEQYEALKYSGESKMSQGEQLLEQMQDHLEKETVRRDTAKRNLENAYKLLSNLKSGIKHLVDTLKDIKVRGSLRNMTILTDDPVEQLNICEIKLLHMMQQANVKDSTTFWRLKNSPEFQEFMENHLAPENLRIRMDEPDAYDSDEFGYDSQDNEDMLTNADIKRQGQNLMNAKKSKRRKKKN
ncbi:outer dynein arm-docking complex subunit 3-like [Lytechinus variegatus]|uniref:outer dynein arm-docking complex subunit 3-like n=1 Tax=Lytechinus variegatus TaxID=7654 RepID=UPI001BB2A205|nr:outer dynein arm-docking complex subunit 3-like [Lytechinus variegatus]